MNYTIKETFTLPSKGLIYDGNVNPEISIRSMTLQEEMLMTSPSPYQYKPMCDAIESCLVDKPGVSVYDMCIGDYQFLLHRMRVVTYGNEYPFTVRCSNCGQWETHTINLEELPVIEYDEDYNSFKVITLPRCGKKIELKFQTPRMLDEIERKRTEMLAKDCDQLDPRLELILTSIIAKVNDEVLPYVSLKNFIYKLSMEDINYIIKSEEKLNERIGIDIVVGCHCGKCGANYLATFRPTQEFFSPSID